jgi:hypothetical protein
MASLEQLCLLFSCHADESVVEEEDFFIVTMRNGYVFWGEFLW